MLRISERKIPIDSSKVSNRKLPLQKKVPLMPTNKRQLVATNCKNCGAKIGKDGVCEYCGSIYGKYENKKPETWGEIITNIENSNFHNKNVCNLMQEYIRLSINSYTDIRK